MLSELTLSHFKSYGDQQTANLSPITLIFGQNSSGKSSLIQSLLLLKQSHTNIAASEAGGLVFNGDHIDLGSFASCVHLQSADHPMTFKLSLTDRERRSASKKRRRDPLMGEFEDADISIELTYSPIKKVKKPTARTKIQLEKYSLQISPRNEKQSPLTLTLLRAENKDTSRLRIPKEAAQYYLTEESAQKYAKHSVQEESRRLERRAKAARASQAENEEPISESDLFELLKTLPFVSERGLLPSPVYSYARIHRRPRALRMGMSIFDMLNYQLGRTFFNMSYLGPLRSAPKRYYFHSETSARTVGSAGDEMPAVIQENNLGKLISEWLARLEVPYSLRLKQFGPKDVELLSIQLTDIRSSVTVSPTDVGFGISQLLPIIVEGEVAKDRVICIEQPEIHLHPKLQAELGDFFIETARADKQGNQWIIETHSETLMLRVLKRIRQGKLSPDQVSVLYVESMGTGTAKIHQLPIDEHGQFLRDWPDGFFEEGVDEFFGE